MILWASARINAEEFRVLSGIILRIASKGMKPVFIIF